MADHRDLERYFRHPEHRVLREGMAGQACVNIRLALDIWGLAPAGSRQNPAFDAALTEAVKEFQRRNNHTAIDGQCGPGTQKLLVTKLLENGSPGVFRFEDPERRHDGAAFVSYARKDIARVEPIIELMKSWGYSIWYDKSLTAGSVWSDQLRERIDQSWQVIAFLSRHSIRREWVRKEIMHASQSGKSLLPIAIDKLPSSYRLKPTLSKHQFLSETPVAYGAMDDALTAKLAAALREAHAKRDTPPPPPPLKLD